ncbi:MAG: imidazole glycerol phosphate synthase subunit HisH [Burkholderiaceae bacterium]
MTEVVVIDYGVGNLLSVQRALEHCGARVEVTADPAKIRASKRVVLPGVGAFADGMAALRSHGLDAVVREVAAAGMPLLGICLGMQMLFGRSDEFGVTPGLGLIPGQVVRIPATTSSSTPQKIPHIGWNELVLPSQRAGWQGTLLDGIAAGDAVYFVHSFMAEPAVPGHRLADCYYGDARVAAAVQRDNVLGCQFHPEKSGAVGLQVLRNFLQS